MIPVFKVGPWGPLPCGILFVQRLLGGGRRGRWLVVANAIRRMGVCRYEEKQMTAVERLAEVGGTFSGCPALTSATATIPLTIQRLYRRLPRSAYD